MSGAVNKVLLVGRLGTNPEIRYTNAGDKFASFSLATSNTWRDKNSGVKKEHTEWHNIVVFNEHIVNFLQQYVKKGARVFIEGQLQTRRWQDQNGDYRYITEVVLKQYHGDLKIFDSKGSADDVADDLEKQHQQSNNIGQQYAAQKGRQTSLDDDIPF